MSKIYYILIAVGILFYTAVTGFAPYNEGSNYSNPIFLSQHSPTSSYGNLSPQVNSPQSPNVVSTYTFSQSTGTYNPAYGGTVLCTSACDDGYFSGIALPFTFTFSGAAYTTVSIQDNGWLQMGTTTPSGYTPICSGGYPNIIVPFARDLDGNSLVDTLRYLTTGTSPNRVFIVEWWHWGFYSGQTNQIDFQVQLYETSNLVKFVYKPETPATTDAQIGCGLEGATTADFISRTSTTSWTATTAGLTSCDYMTFSSTIYPTSGLTFTWTPAVVTGPPTVTTTTPVATGITTATSGGNVTDQGGSSVTARGVCWSTSANPSITDSHTSDGTGTGVFTSSITGLTGGTLYHVRAYATNTSGTAYGTDLTFTTCTATSIPYSEGFESAVLPSFPCAWTIPTSGNPATYTGSQTYNRAPHTGLNYASFYYNSTQKWAISPGIPLISGTTYLFSMWYITDGIGGWTNLSAYYNTTASSTGMTAITGATVSGPTNTTYTQMTGSITPSTTGTYYIGVSCTDNGAPWYLTFDDISLTVAPPMGYVSSTTAQVTPGVPVASGTLNNPIIQVQVVDTGFTSAISISKFRFETTGSNNPTADISNAKVYFTGNSSTFSTATLFGSQANPNGVFNISGSASLVGNTTNYFWLTYDTKPGAVGGDSLDAQCDSIIGTSPMNGRVPTIIAPLGSRPITAPLCGTYTIPGSYPTIAAAISAVNTIPSTCPVTFNVAANYVETGINLVFNAGGTASAPITFQKSGTGANPRIRAGSGVGSYDGIIIFNGVNYITFDGIDVVDTATNLTTTTQPEFGYALLRPDGTHGCQHITIKNCNIILNKTNTLTYGIYSSYQNLAGTYLTITAASGTNSFNSFLSDNISNCYSGIYLYSFSDGVIPYAKEDQNNVVSTIGTGRSSITNFGYSTGTSYGIYAYYQRNPQFSNTLINSNGGTVTSGSLYGIYDFDYYNNANEVITGDTLTLVTTGTTAYLYGIYCYSYYGVDHIISNNVLTGFVNPTTSSYYSYYIYTSNASGSNTYQNSYTITGNKIIGNIYGTAGLATGGTYNIYSYDYCTAYKNISNNLDSGNTIRGTSAYVQYGIYSPSAPFAGRISNNRIVNDTLCGTTFASTTYGIYNSGGSLSCIMDSNVVSNNYLPSTSTASIYFLYNTAAAGIQDFSYNNVSNNTSPGSGTFYSMYYAAAPGIGSTVNISNNTISNQNKTTATGTGSIFGIYQGSTPAGTININNNVVTGFASAAATTLYGIYQASSPPNFLNIINNKVGNYNTQGAGSIYGIYTGGTTTTIENISQDSVYNLTSLGGTIYGMYCVSGNPANIFRNTINGIYSTTSTSASVYGMYVSGGVINNIYNNFVYDINAPASTINPAVSGIYLSGGTFDNLYYNTVLLKAVSTSATTFSTNALYASTTPNVDMRNNILVDSSTPGPTTSFAVAYRRSANSLTTYLNTSNNNCFYAGTPSASHLIFYDGTNSMQTLAAYKTFIVPRDINACTEMPPFISSVAPFDLRIKTNVATQLESGGQTISTPLNNITTDAFNTPRFPNTGYPVGTFTPKAPDIGATEFGGVNGDQVPPSISYTPLGIGGTSNRVFPNVIITDNSGVNVTTGTKPRCYYKRSTDGNVINDNTSGTDGWKYVESNGTTSPFDFTIDYSKLNGGTGVLAGQVIWYFIIAQDLASTPNVGANQAAFTTNPSTVALVSGNAPITNTLTYSIGVGTFSGSYNVGTGQTYTSLTGAAGIFAAINNGTVAGDITINITSDLLEDGTNQLNALNETGSGRYKVKIVPAAASMKTISGWVSQAIIRLNGVRRVTIDGNNGLGSGKYLTFRNMTTSYPTIQFQNETGVDTLKNCYVESNNINTASGTIYFGQTTLATGFGNDSICVNSCDIRNRTDTAVTGVGPANGIYSLGTSNTLQTYNNYNSVINCNIYDNFYDAGTTIAGIYLTSYNSDWVISGNSFYQTVPRTVSSSSTFTGIYCASTLNNDLIITNNYFGGNAPSCGGTAMTYSGAGLYNYYGMYLNPGSVVPTSIQGNVIQNISLTTSPASGSSTFFMGIFIASACYCNIGNIAGNTIGSGTGTGSITLTVNTTTTGYTVRGIYHVGIGNISNNTIGSITLGGNAVITATPFAIYGIQWSSTVSGWTYTCNNNLVGSISTPNSIQVKDSLSWGQFRGIVNGNGAGTINNITNNIVANATVNAQAATITTSYISIIYGFSLSNLGNDNILNNSIYNLTLNTNQTYGAATFTLLGIAHASTGVHNISQNNIYSLYENHSGAGYGFTAGMYVGGAGGTTISRNKIYDMGYSGTAVSTLSVEQTGIFISASIIGPNSIFNNMVSLTNGDASYKPENVKILKHEDIPMIEKQKAPDSYIAQNSKEKIGLDAVVKIPPPGVETALTAPKSKNSRDEVNSANSVSIAGIITQTGATYKANCNYFYNSVYVGGSQPSGATYNSWAFLKQFPGELVLRNNIFFNARTGGTGFHYAIGNEASPAGDSWSSTSSDYDLLIGANATLGEWGTGVPQTFAQWQGSSFGDVNSISDIPANIPGTILFRSIPTANLNIDTTQFGASYVYQRGIGITGISNDFNGYPRNQSGPVCIGAHEFALNKPLVSTLLLPANGSTGVQTPVTLVWRKALFAATYRVQIATDSLFSNIVTTGTPSDSTYIFNGASALTYYYWRVNSVYSTGGNGPFSTFFKFKVIGAPNTVVLNSPPNGATGQATSVIFKWLRPSEQTLLNRAINTKTKSEATLDNNLKNNKTNETPNANGKTLSNFWFELSADSNFVNNVTRDSTLTDTTKSVTGLLNGTTYYWRVKAKNQLAWGSFSSRWSFSTVAAGLPLNLKVYLEGFWGGTTQITDTVRIYLANSTSPYAYVDTAKLVLSSTGTATPTFMRASAGSYYIVVIHRNHLETWSALPQTFNPGVPVNYDFTTAATQAFGSNMKQVGSVWVLIVGDENQDGSIDAGDAADFINQYGNIGYLTCDFNGDLSVDAADVPFLIANYGLTKVVPTLIEIPPEIRNQKTIIKKNELNEMFKQQKNKNTNKNN